MGIYHRARRSALAAVFACCATAGIGMAVAPGAALAVSCANTTGSGSTLQTKQQETFIAEYKKLGKLGTCAAVPTITYNSPNATGSGKGLEEFGMTTGKLVPGNAGNGKSELDGYVGTDDPPNETELANAKTASESAAETAPTVAAPVAVILHPPAGCEITSAELKISNEVLNKLWLEGYANWKLFLTAAGATFAGTCEVAIQKEVRFDSSGTSFAFKNYLCQIEELILKKPECPKWKAFVSDASSWPAGTAEKKEHKEGGVEVPNKGSGGEANAVKEEAGSVGYVNLADAVSKGFEAYKAKGTKVWAKIQDNGIEAAVEAAEPGKEEEGKKEGNCPSTLTTAQEEALPTEGAKGTGKVKNAPNWSLFHLASPKTASKKVYSICTLTYDIGWEKYVTTILKGATAYKSQKGAEETGNTALQYFKYMTTTGASGGQGHIAEYYSPLGTRILTLAQEVAAKV